MLHTGVLKGYLDGSLGSRTAALLAPYADDPKNTGIPLSTNRTSSTRWSSSGSASVSASRFHAIGDRAFEMALNAFEAAANDMKQRHTPMEKLPDFHSFRVEHAQVTNPELLKRAAQMELIMSMQPCHLLTDMNWAEQRLGPERAKNSYAVEVGAGEQTAAGFRNGLIQWSLSRPSGVFTRRSRARMRPARKNIIRRRS